MIARAISAFAAPLAVSSSASRLAALPTLCSRAASAAAATPIRPHFPRRHASAFAASTPPSSTSSTNTRSAATMTAGNHLKEGDKVPDVVFKTRERIPELEGKTENPFDWVDKTSADYFKGRRVVLFALPGAFTPTCSATHLPGYERDHAAITACGVDDVYCLSVNDAFVMRQWGIAQKADKVKLIPDGAAAFTTAMGMGCNWTTERGFGLRSWRYSMVVNDMVIEKLFVEPDFVENSGPDPFVVSDSKTMLEYLQSKK